LTRPIGAARGDNKGVRLGVEKDLHLIKEIDAKLRQSVRRSRQPRRAFSATIRYSARA
jgi:hypothetical protein